MQSTRVQDNDHKYAQQTFENDFELLKICLRPKVKMNTVRILKICKNINKNQTEQKNAITEIKIYQKKSTVD